MFFSLILMPWCSYNKEGRLGGCWSSLWALGRCFVGLCEWLAARSITGAGR